MELVEYPMKIVFTIILLFTVIYLFGDDDSPKNNKTK